nr:Biomphalaria glabrata rhomboid-related protein 3-like; transcript variant X2 [Biomphalaria glabrata]
MNLKFSFTVRSCCMLVDYIEYTRARNADTSRVICRSQTAIINYKCKAYHNFDSNQQSMEDWSSHISIGIDTRII